MKLDLTPVRSSYVAPTFGGDDRLPIDPALQRRMRRPMIIGALIIAFLVVGLGLWASLSPLKTGVTSQGEVAVSGSPCGPCGGGRCCSTSSSRAAHGR